MLRSVYIMYIVFHLLEASWGRLVMEEGPNGYILVGKLSLHTY